MKLKDKISWIAGRLQRSLFPILEEYCISPLTEQEKRLVEMLEIIEIEKYIPSHRQWMGRPAAERKTIARCYVAKAVLRYPHTRILIHELQARPNLRLICGFMKQKAVPSESTFSRAFAAFAETDLGRTVHNAMVREYLGGELIGHVSRDSTAIVGREKAAKKVPVIKLPRKKGRPAKAEQRQPPGTKTFGQAIATDGGRGCC